MYSSRQEDNTKKLLLEYYTRADERLQQKEFSSFALDQPVVVQESYILPFNVKGLALTQTLHHITGKNLVVITQNNLVYQIDHNLFTARRPHSDNLVLSGGVSAPEEKKPEQSQIVTSSDLKSKDLLVYDAVIPLLPTKYLSYGQQLVDLKEVKAFPSRLESTTQVLVYGFDVFFVRFSPDNNFDVLQEYFNYTMLFMCIAGLGIATYLVKGYVSKTKRRNNFLMM